MRWHGLLSEVHDTKLESEIWNENLHDVVSVLEQADIPHVLVSDRFEPARIAVQEHDRAAVVEAMAKHLRSAPFYVDLRDALGETRGTVLARQIGDAAPVPALVVYRSVVTTSRTLTYGPEQGCTIEFWAQDEETKDFVAPAPFAFPSRRGFALSSLAPDATITVGDRERGHHARHARTHERRHLLPHRLRVDVARRRRPGMDGTPRPAPAGGRGQAVRSARRRPVRQPGRAQVLDAVGRRCTRRGSGTCTW